MFITESIPDTRRKMLKNYVYQNSPKKKLNNIGTSKTSRIKMKRRE